MDFKINRKLLPAKIAFFGMLSGKYDSDNFISIEIKMILKSLQGIVSLHCTSDQLTKQSKLFEG